MGKSITLSFDVKVGADYSAASGRIEVTIATGSGVDEGLAGLVAETWTGFTKTTTNVDTLTTSWVRRSVTVSTTAGHKELGILFQWTPVGTAGSNDWVELRNIQLEEGTVATPFEPRTVAAELVLCQRYYERLTKGILVVATTTGQAEGTCSWKVEKRVAPTLSQFATTGDELVSLGVGARQVTGISGSVAGVDGAYLVVQDSGSGYTANQLMVGYTADRWLVADAEIN